MDEITNMPQWSFDLFGYGVTLNTLPLINTWMIMAVLILFGFLATRQTKLVPNPLQSMAEMLIKVFDDMVYDALEVEDYRKYFPLICGLFLFLWLSNIWGIIPFFSEPTKDLNTPLSLGLLGFVVAHYSGIRAKGLKAYLGQYFEPFIFMAPLNIIGELAKVVSISFRLYGNIMGGSIIIIVVGHLIYSLVLPPFLNAFFGLFVGTIQAFVFTMLTLVYISVQIK
jgi:F-type H+-transporting ATPase subunit a